MNVIATGSSDFEHQEKIDTKSRQDDDVCSIGSISARDA